MRSGSPVGQLRQLKRVAVFGAKTVRTIFNNQTEVAKAYMFSRSQKRPWSTGYVAYRRKYLSAVLQDPELLKVFNTTEEIPQGYGHRLDARMIEIPWVLSRLPEQAIRILDAGSSLNHFEVISSPKLRDKSLTILTLAPEANCYWEQGISYVYDDLRDAPFKNGLFDVVTCVSTIEHLGMDNSFYAEKLDAARPGSQKAYLTAAQELKRVLKPGGTILITFPFGTYQNLGWFQQFNAEMADELIDAFQPKMIHEAIFRYLPDGWVKSTREACAECEFFDVRQSKYFDPTSTIEYPPDFPAGERAVACLELRL